MTGAPGVVTGEPFATVSTDLTRLVEDLAQGKEGAANRLLPAVYDELRAMAQRMFARRQASDSLPATALVHEAYLRLVDPDRCAPEGRTHFFNIAALAMRQVLADHARRRRASKRGGEWARVDLGRVDVDTSPVDIDLIDLDDALTELGQLDERQVRVVELRYLAGLTILETAEVLGVSPRTVDLDWRVARAWLRQRLGATLE